MDVCLVCQRVMSWSFTGHRRLKVKSKGRGSLLYRNEWLKIQKDFFFFQVAKCPLLLSSTAINLSLTTPVCIVQQCNCAITLFQQICIIWRMGGNTVLFHRPCDDKTQHFLSSECADLPLGEASVAMQFVRHLGVQAAFVLLPTLCFEEAKKEGKSFNVIASQCLNQPLIYCYSMARAHWLQSIVSLWRRTTGCCDIVKGRKQKKARC